MRRLFPEAGETRAIGSPFACAFKTELLLLLPVSLLLLSCCPWRQDPSASACLPVPWFCPQEWREEPYCWTSLLPENLLNLKLISCSSSSSMEAQPKSRPVHTAIPSSSSSSSLALATE